MQKYVFRKYNADYPRFFVLERRKIAKALGPTAKIEHVGSTSIRDLGGKGILDIVIGISKSNLMKAKEKLEKAGYEFREKASYPERLFFRIDYLYRGRKRRVHIHLTIFDHKDWQEMIGFRDYLQKHPIAVDCTSLFMCTGISSFTGIP